MYQKNKTGINKLGKSYVLGITLICGLLLLSVDDCEGMSELEQAHYAQMEAARTGQDKTLAARMEQEAAMQKAIREKADAEQTARTRAEEERLAARNKTNAQTAQNQAAARTPASAAQTTGGRTAAGGQSGRTQTAAGGTTTAAAAAGTSPAASESSAASQGTGQDNAVQTGSTGANYVASIAGKSWKLTELRFVDKTVVLNRGELSGGEADIFTLTFDNERLSGKGAPNRYFTAYQAGTNNALTIRPIASTMMAAIVANPQRIREPDYFQYLAKVKSWNVSQNKLELNSLDKTNKDLVMVFSN